MNEKLVINANLLRKEPEFGTRVCVVEKAEAVTHEKFEHLKRHPMQDNDLIAENTDLPAMLREQSKAHGLPQGRRWCRL